MNQNIEMRKMKRNIEILKQKKQSIVDSKFGRNEDAKVGDDTERFMLNMEMLTWIINTDSLFLNTSEEYKRNKIIFKVKETLRKNGNVFNITELANSLKVRNRTILEEIYAEYRRDKDNFKNRRDDSECHAILLGLYYAFNCFKHSMQIESMEKINEIAFLETEDTKYSIANNVWLETSESMDSTRFEYKIYKDYLVGKNVFKTFSEAIDFLNKQYDFIKQADKR